MTQRVNDDLVTDLLESAPPESEPTPDATSPDQAGAASGATDAVAGDLAQAQPSAPSPPEPVATPDLANLREQLDLIRQRNELLEREVQFVRAGLQPQTPQADPIQDSLQSLTVNEDDLAEVLAGGPKATALVTRALQHTMLRTAQLVEQRLLAAYQQDQAQRQQQVDATTTATRMREQFWSQHADLEPYTPLVQHFAREVAQEAPQRRFDWAQAQTEVANRTRKYLNSVGIALAPPPPQAAQRQGIRPPVGEMGGGRGASGGSKSQFEQMFGDLLQ